MVRGKVTTEKRRKRAIAPGVAGVPEGLRWRNRIVEFRRNVPADTIRRNPRNPYEHGDKQRSKLLASFEEFGVVGAVLTRLLDDGGLELVDGELRTTELGGEPVDAIVTDLTEEEAVKFIACSRQIGDLAEINFDVLEAIADEETFFNDALGELVRQTVEEERPREKAAPRGEKAARRSVELKLTAREVAQFEKWERALRHFFEVGREADTVLAALRAAFDRLPPEDRKRAAGKKRSRRAKGEKGDEG